MAASIGVAFLWSILVLATWMIIIGIYTPFINHLTKLIQFMNGGVIHNDHQVWLRERVHVVEKCIDETVELESSVGTVLNCEV